jgi:acetyl-CoA acetyltransferase
MSKENEAVILSAARTPIGKFQGALSTIPATKLGAVAVKAAVERAGIDPGEVEEVIDGKCRRGGIGTSPGASIWDFWRGAGYGERHHAEQGLRVGLEGGDVVGASHPRRGR